MSGVELAEHFGITLTNHDRVLPEDRAPLEQALQQAGVNYHKDSRGEIWASISIV